MGDFALKIVVRTALPLIPCLPDIICTVIGRKCPPTPICPLTFSPSLFCCPFSFLSSLSTVSFSGFFSLYFSVSLFLLFRSVALQNPISPLVTTLETLFDLSSSLFCRPFSLLFSLSILNFLVFLLSTVLCFSFFFFEVLLCKGLFFPLIFSFYCQLCSPILCLYILCFISLSLSLYCFVSLCLFFLSILGVQALDFEVVL